MIAAKFSFETIWHFSVNFEQNKAMGNVWAMKDYDEKKQRHSLSLA
jgi:hypothetical protein